MEEGGKEDILNIRWYQILSPKFDSNYKICIIKSSRGSLHVNSHWCYVWFKYIEFVFLSEVPIGNSEIQKLFQMWVFSASPTKSFKKHIANFAFSKIGYMQKMNEVPNHKQQGLKILNATEPPSLLLVYWYSIL